jgi:hypothetical protein
MSAHLPRTIQFLSHIHWVVIVLLTMSLTRKSPFRLVTVNTAPERAKRLISRMIEALQDRYEIEHVANCSSTRVLSSCLPNLLTCH